MFHVVAPALFISSASRLILEVGGASLISASPKRRMIARFTFSSNASDFQRLGGWYQ